MMKLNSVFLTVIVFLFCSVAANGLLALKLSSSNKLLDSLQKVAHLGHIQDVRDRLGPEMYEINESTWMVQNASITDSDFHDEKKLYWFYVTAPPARVVEVYTDLNGKVMVVTWQSM